MPNPAPGCPVHESFDPLGDPFLRDPYAVMDALPLEETPHLCAIPQQAATSPWGIWTTPTPAVAAEAEAGVGT